MVARTQEVLQEFRQGGQADKTWDYPEEELLQNSKRQKYDPEKLEELTDQHEYKRGRGTHFIAATIITIGCP